MFRERRISVTGTFDSEGLFRRASPIVRSLIDAISVRFCPKMPQPLRLDIWISLLKTDDGAGRRHAVCVSTSNLIGGVPHARDDERKTMSDSTQEFKDATDDLGHTPGAAGHPEPGSGHDDAQTVTVEDGPPIRKTDGEEGAFSKGPIDPTNSSPSE